MVLIRYRYFILFVFGYMFTAAFLASSADFETNKGFHLYLTDSFMEHGHTYAFDPIYGHELIHQMLYGHSRVWNRRHFLCLLSNQTKRLISDSEILQSKNKQDARTFKYAMKKTCKYSYNIAYGKYTEQGPSDYCGGPHKFCHPSNLSVNGDTNGNVDEGNCSHTYGEVNPGYSWWKVHFGGGYYLSTIKIFRRSDECFSSGECMDRFKGFQIDGLDNSTNATNIYTDGILNTVYNNSVINLTLPESLRKNRFMGIKISVKNNLLTLCEVQVFLAPNCSVPVIRNGTIVWESQALDFVPSGTSLRVNCYKGFRLNLETEFLHCKDNGWNTYESPLCSEIISPSSSNTALIGGAVGAGVCIAVIGVVICVVIVLRKKRFTGNKCSSQVISRRSEANERNVDSNRTAAQRNDLAFKSINNVEISHAYETMDSSAVSNIQDESQYKYDSSHRSGANGSQDEKQEEYYNITSFENKSATALMLTDLAEFLVMEEARITKLQEQFNDFPIGLTKKHAAALRKENIKKNRYKHVYAYDDNRVILKTDDKTESDYINASYIHGYNRVKSYIASQGPTVDMINDFWKMIYQEDTEKLIMLTNLTEENKMKCIQYWPYKESQLFGKITVSLMDVEQHSDFVVRTLAVKQKSHAPHEERIVRQFHYTAWPDKGVPKFSSSLLDFQKKVRNTRSYGRGPVVIHCSAGVGRTGTYIALDILTEQGKALGYVDVCGCVAALRRQRVNMVQTLDQYVFLHSALTEALVFSSPAIPASEFHDVYYELLQENPDKRKRNIEIKFGMLKELSPITEDKEYVSAREVRNKKRNRYSNILPVSDFMPKIKGTSQDGYINAVYLPNYKDSKALILTQMPLAKTKKDFWSLVLEHNVHTIVMMNTVAEVEKEEIYWPEVGKCQNFDVAEVACVRQETTGHHNIIRLNVPLDDTTRTVTQIQCLYWPAKQDLPSSPFEIIETLELVEKLQQRSGNHPVIVHCMNGVDRSGLYCVITAVIERLKIEQDVAITQVIEQMRCRRCQIIPTLDQFQFCHDVVQAYIQKFNEYSNFSGL